MQKQTRQPREEQNQVVHERLVSNLFKSTFNSEKSDNPHENHIYIVKWNPLRVLIYEASQIKLIAVDQCYILGSTRNKEYALILFQNAKSLSSKKCNMKQSKCKVELGMN